MSIESNPLPDDVLGALQAGQTIEAIKLLRTATGLGLKEVKDIIDAYNQGLPETVSFASSMDELPVSVRHSIQSGNKIEAIKLLCEQTGLGLKEAKDAVEALPKGKFGNIDQYPTIERPRSSAAIWWLVGVAGLGFTAYYFLQ